MFSGATAPAGYSSEITRPIAGRRLVVVPGAVLTMSVAADAFV